MGDTMKNGKLVLAVALAAACFACRGASPRPTKERQPLQSDFDRCLKAARDFGNPSLAGSMTLKLYVDADGAVPFAFINDQTGLDSPQFDHCVLDFMALTKFQGEGLDYLRPYGKVSVGRESGVMLPDFKDIPKEPLDVQKAQSTLEFADWADDVDKGWGYFYTQQYDKAVGQFRGALQKKADDTRALRGLASTLAAQGGDANLKEARDTAAKAIQLKPDSEATHEAMMRVCIAAKDDACIFEEFEKARKEPDVNVRSIELATMQDAAKGAADRLQGEEHQKHEEEVQKQKAAAEARAKKLDPKGCSKMPEGSEERTLCFVQTCFEDGGVAYADSLKGLTGAEYKAGAWKIAETKGGKLKVQVPIRAEGAQNHDAHWEVQQQDNGGYTMKPLDIDANNIQTQHNACAKQ